ncbi:MAG: hypothetical protein AABW79_02725 [Nanoarchaeota archaeon]
MSNTKHPKMDYKIHYKDGIAFKVTTSCQIKCTDATCKPSQTTDYRVLSDYEKTENGYSYPHEDTWHGKGLQNYPLTLEDLVELDSHNPFLLPVSKILGTSRKDIEKLLTQNNHKVEHLENK